MNADHPVNELNGTKGPHWGEARCLKCDSWIEFVSKPGELRDKARRESAHKKIAKKYSEGYCQVCLILEDKLPLGESLEGHHIVEYQDGGEPTRENTLICCTACHSLIHWRRTYQQHIVGEKGVFHAQG